MLCQYIMTMSLAITDIFGVVGAILWSRSAEFVTCENFMIVFNSLQDYFPCKQMHVNEEKQRTTLHFR